VKVTSKDKSLWGSTNVRTKVSNISHFIRHYITHKHIYIWATQCSQLLLNLNLNNKSNVYLYFN
jgi:hypothetical protein